MSLIYMTAGLTLSERIAWFLGADGAVFEMTETYLKTILLMSPLFLAGDIFTCFVRCDGEPGLSMAAMIIASLSNIVMDYIFIFPLKMGIFGAAFATGTAPFISMAVLSLYMRKKERFRAAYSLPSIKETGKILAAGFPSLITELSAGIIMALFNFLILKIEGNIGVAAYGIIANLSLVAIALCTGTAQGMQPLVARVHGKNDKFSEKLLFKYSIRICVLAAMVIYVLLVVFAGRITAVFNGENNLKLAQLAERGIFIYFLMLPFAGINIVTSMFFASIEKPVSAQIISAARGFAVIVPAVILAAQLAGIVGIWFSVAVSEIVTFAVGETLYINLKKSWQ